MSRLSRRSIIGAAGAGALLMPSRSLWAHSLDTTKIDPSVYFEHVLRVVGAMKRIGSPFSDADEQQLFSLASASSDQNIHDAEKILNRYTLMSVSLNRQGIGTSTAGGSDGILVEQGWRAFLIRVVNPFGLKSGLSFESSALNNRVQWKLNDWQLAFHGSGSVGENGALLEGYAKPEDIAKEWMGFSMYAEPPLQEGLSGAPLDYKIIEIFCRDRGKKSAYLQSHSSRAPYILVTAEKRGFTADFRSTKASDVTLDIKDWDGVGATAYVIIRDARNRLYPSVLQRLEPDLSFQPQIYRANGESVRLPSGQYTVTQWRGPEYLKETQSVTIGGSDGTRNIDIRLKRWIDAAAHGWYPGDTHIHPSGCKHYEVPTPGVTPSTMARHVRGEALSVGSLLIWGPSYYHQKEYFTGHVHKPNGALGHPDYQKANNTTLKPKSTPRDDESMIRYDLEVSVFPSAHSGHPVLLGLKDQNFPDTNEIKDWPSWNLPVLRWAKSQGAVVGFAHVGYAFEVESSELPNYEMPTMNDVGANEYFVDITHDAVDFVSGAQMAPTKELNLWYHSLNCGFEISMVGETDFPCDAGYERVGTGRTYVGLETPPTGDAGYAAWIQGVKNGRVYFGDGRSHFIDYTINGRPVGEDSVALSDPGEVQIDLKIAAYLDEEPFDPDINTETPKYLYWHLERARIEGTRTVPLEVIINGLPVLTKAVLADGKLRDFQFTIPIERSSWVALRILPSGHTNPIYVTIGDKPVRASRRSAQWLLDCLDILWNEKSYRIRTEERAEAKDAYDHARKIYRRIRSECDVL
ncbi:MAG: CehA/McbA family metallohydrolase [Pseudomonadota bacterium]